MHFWKVYFTVPVQASLALVELFEDIALSVTMKEGTDSSEWQIIIFFEIQPDRSQIEKLINETMDSLGLSRPKILIEMQEDKDWLTESWQSFPPLEVGPFYIFGSHGGFSPPGNKIPLEVNAATAFGTGEHETTKGCLLAIANLANIPRNPLDMGCGSGILAMAISKLWNIPVLAVDLDPEAVRVTKENAQLNGCQHHLTVAVSDGFESDIIKEKAPYDLIVANILAGPLVSMASPISQCLIPGGKVILSGLLVTQAPEVIAAYENQGMDMITQQQEGEWAILVFEKNDEGE